MTLNITEELERTFEQAISEHEAKRIKQHGVTRSVGRAFGASTMEHEAESLRTHDDWAEAQKIQKRGEAERAHLEERYVKEYDTRVETARKRLIDEAGEFNLTFPSPQGVDLFDKSTINRQAHRDVQFDHANDLQRSQNRQDADIDALMARARGRDTPESQVRGLAKQHFDLARDQRQSPDRHAPNRSR